MPKGIKYVISCDGCKKILRVHGIKEDDYYLNHKTKEYLCTQCMRKGGG